MKDILSEIASSTVARYSDRYKKLGRNVRALGWGSDEQQRYRFEQVLRGVSLEGKSVLDIGCGFGDLLSYCLDARCKPASYIGWDINTDLITEAKKLHPSSTFTVLNLAEQAPKSPVANVGVMLGVLNFNFEGNYDNKKFTKMMLKKAFTSVSESLVVDFLSTYRTPSYPKEDSVFYHDPTKMLAYALELTPHVRLLHDYAPIPQKEFMLVLEHV
ncbi:MAG: SAM-dependent methyltransferase [Oleiphilaceae bacterium]|jgi:SAM-dependent methyltransferase